MSGFSTDWLDLREDADRRARDRELMARVRQWLHPGGPATQAPLVVDLGAGTGSTVRAFDQPIHRQVAWRLVDHDSTLLAEAQRRHGPQPHLETVVADLAQISALPLRDARLITASALFDLVSAGFIDALAQVLRTQCRHSPVGLYAALNYDGSTRWTPTHPLDDVVLDQFNRDQRRDKGFGPALGPDASDAIKRAFTQAGFEVRYAASPWVLDGADEALVAALASGIADAVAGGSGLDASALADWLRFRLAKAPFGTCTVGHADLLALPH